MSVPIRSRRRPRLLPVVLAAAASAALVLSGGAAAHADESEVKIGVGYEVEKSVALPAGEYVEQILPHPTKPEFVVLSTGGVYTYDSSSFALKSSYAVSGIRNIAISEVTGNHILPAFRTVEVRNPETGTVLGTAPKRVGSDLLVVGDSIWSTPRNNVFARYSESSIIAGDASEKATIATPHGSPRTASTAAGLIYVTKSAAGVGTLTAYDSLTGEARTTATFPQNIALRWVGERLFVVRGSAELIDGQPYDGLSELDPRSLDVKSTAPKNLRSLSVVLPGLDAGTLSLVHGRPSNAGYYFGAYDATTLTPAGGLTKLAEGTSIRAYDPTSGLYLSDRADGGVVHIDGYRAKKVEWTPVEPGGPGGPGTGPVDEGGRIVGLATEGGLLDWGIKESWRTYLTTGHASSTAKITKTAPLTQNSDGTWRWAGAAPSGVYDAEAHTLRVTYEGGIHFTAYNGALDMAIDRVTILINKTDKGTVGTVLVSGHGNADPSKALTDVPLGVLDLSGVTPATTGAQVSYSNVPVRYIRDTGRLFFDTFYDDGVVIDPVSFSFSTTAVPAEWSPAAAPTVKTHPASATVLEGESATFTAAAEGSPRPTVKWQSKLPDAGDWMDVPGATSGTLTVSALAGTASGVQYRAVFTNSEGSVTTDAATLTVSVRPVAPAVTTQPQAVSIAEGGSATLTATASGVPAPTVQWQQRASVAGEWSDVAGATGGALVVSDVPGYRTGTQYRAVFRNSAGQAVSEAAAVMVIPRTELPPVLPGTGFVPKESDLTVAARGGVTAPSEATAGSTVTVSVGAQHAGEKVHAYLFSTPVSLGSHTVASDGKIRVALPADVTGEHRIAVYIENGALLGWAPVRISAAGAGQLAVTGSPETSGLLAGAAVLVLGGVAVMLFSRRRRTA